MELNLNNLYSLWTTDYKTRLLINCWNGNTSITIFFDQDQKPYQTRLENDTLFLIKSLLGKIQKEFTPNIKSSLVLSYYDKETNTRINGSTISIGRDEKSLIYIEIANNDFPSICRFVFSTSKNVSLESSDSVFDDSARNTYGSKAFLSFLNTDLVVAKLISRDAEKMKKATEAWKARNNNNPTPLPKSEDDVSF